MSITTIEGALTGVVRNGVVVFAAGEGLPEGTTVQVVATPAPVAAEPRRRQFVSAHGNSAK